MKHLAFEWKKLRKSGLLFWVVIVALLLGGANQLYARSEIADDYTYVTSLGLRVQNLSNTLLGDMIRSGRTNAITYCEKVISPMQEMMADEGRNYYLSLKPSSELFTRAIICARADGLDYSLEQENEIRFALLLTRRLETLNMEEESLDHPTALYFIKRGFPLLFGILPFILFLALAHRFQSEDVEKGSLVYNACLPKSRRRTLLSRFVALSLLVAVYIVVVALTSLGFSLASGLPFGVLGMPNQILGVHEFFLTHAGLLGFVFLDCLLRLMLAISLGLFTSIYLSGKTSLRVLTSLIAFFAYFLTTQFPILQKQLNPLYFEYQSRFLGTRYLNLDSPDYNFIVKAPQANAILWMGLGIPLLILLGLTLFSPQDKQRLEEEEQKPTHSLGRRLMSGSLYGIYFEWRKLDEELLFRQGISVFLALSCFLCGLMIVRDRFTLEDTKWDKQIKSYEESIQNKQQRVDEISQKLKSGETDGDSTKIHQEKQLLEYSILDEQDQISQIRERKKAYEEGNIAEFYQMNVEEINSEFGRLAYMDYVGPDLYVNGRYPSNFGYEVNLKRNEALIEREIPPLLRGETVATIYDVAKDRIRQRHIAQKLQLADHSVLGLTQRLAESYRVDLILLLLLVFSCGAGYSIEQQKSSSLCWVYTLPQNRKRIVLQKYAASWVRAMQYLLCFILPLFILGLATGGMGNFNFPILRYLRPVLDAQEGKSFSGMYELANLGSQIIRASVLMICATTFILALSLLLSLWARQMAVTWSGTILVLVCGYLASFRSEASSLTAYLPFAYLDVKRLVRGELLAQSGNLLFTAERGMVVFLIWTVLLLSAAMLYVAVVREVVKKERTVN